MSGLTIVMPVFNEAANLSRVLTEVRRTIVDAVPGTRLIIVDDCSTDDSPAILAAAAGADPRITVLTNATNRGHGPSVRSGWDHATTPWILAIDSDGQVDLAAFGTLWAAAADADLVLGVRVDRGDPLHRRLVTAGTRTLASGLARRRLSDANTPFKLIRRDLFEHLRGHVPDDAFAPSVLLLVAAVRSGARVVEVPVRQLPRLSGRSSLHARRLGSAVLRSVSETVRVARRPVARYVASTEVIEAGGRA